MLRPTLALELAALGGRLGNCVLPCWPHATVGKLAVDQELNLDRPIVAARQELGVNVLMTLSQTP